MAGVDKYFERSSRYVLQEQYESLRIDSLGKLENFKLSSQGKCLFYSSLVSYKGKQRDYFVILVQKGARHG